MRLIFGLLALSFVISGAEWTPYCWGFLNGVPNRADLPQAEVEAIQAGHMAHMQRMANAGRLVAAGPLATPGGPRGLLVYRCENVEQAVEWTALDPAVVNKRLTVEMVAWKSSGVFGEPLASKLKADPKYPVNMVRLPFAMMVRTEKAAAGAKADVLAAHEAYWMDMQKQGKVRAFGPFAGSAEMHGVAVYAAMELEEARQLAEQDPLVKGGWARPVMHLWFVAEEAVPK